jgi:hypothetical protein
VYYRASIGDAGEDARPDRRFTEERSVGFRVRDASGSLRIFPRGGRFDAPVRFDGETGSLGDEPTGLDIRRGGATKASKTDDAVAAAELLRVRQPSDWSPLAGLGGSDGRRSYEERRLEPGDEVTIVGHALPFGDLSDPAGADLGQASSLDDDPVVAGDLAAARAAGTLADTPAEAWGNAAIPGFGIGRPVTTPELHPDADPLPLGTAEEAAESARTFEIEPETLVLTATDEVPLLVAYGTPGAVVERNRRQLLIGLAGAILAIGSAMVFAVAFNGEFGR